MANSAPKLDPRGRKVKILATVGPASRSPEMLARLFKAGGDAFRVNMSHGEHADHAKTIEASRAMEKQFMRPIAILADIQGPKLRVGKFKDGQAVILHSGHYKLDRNPEPGDETRVELPHPELFGLLEKGQRSPLGSSKNIAMANHRRRHGFLPDVFVALTCNFNGLAFRSCSADLSVVALRNQSTLLENNILALRVRLCIRLRDMPIPLGPASFGLNFLANPMESTHLSITASVVYVFLENPS